MPDRKSFTELLREKSRPLVLDGAVGSLLQSELKLESSPLWSSELNITHPDKIIELHKKYIDAGADIITTNTFRTNPAALNESRIDLEPAEFVEKSVRLALEARADKNVLVAGSNAPAEDCYQKERSISEKELINNHKFHINALLESGVDFILNETMSHFDEIKITSNYCSEQDIPFITSFYLTEGQKILSGQNFYEVMDYLNKFAPLAIGINCISPELFSQIDFKHLSNLSWGFYLNCGAGDVTDEEISCGISPEVYVAELKKYIKLSPSFIGSCCGSSPSHTKAIREYLDGINKS